MKVNFIFIYMYQHHLYQQLFRDALMHSNYHLQLVILQNFSNHAFFHFLHLHLHESKHQIKVDLLFYLFYYHQYFLLVLLQLYQLEHILSYHIILTFFFLQQLFHQILVVQFLLFCSQLLLSIISFPNCLSRVHHHKDLLYHYLLFQAFFQLVNLILVQQKHYFTIFIHFLLKLHYVKHHLSFLQQRHHYPKRLIQQMFFGFSLLCSFERQLISELTHDQLLQFQKCLNLDMIIQLRLQ